MDVTVASKVGHVLTRSLGGLSLAEGSMLLRLRRASIALLGLVGAVGLGLVFFISQIGWPAVLSGPLPGAPSRIGTVHDAVALTHSRPAIATARPASVSAGQGAGGVARRDPGLSGGSRLDQSKPSGDGTGVHPAHGISQPGSPQPAPESAVPAPTPSPSATPTVASSPPASTSEPVKTSASTKTSEAAVAKAVSDNSKSATATATKSQGQKSAKDQGSSGGSTPSEASSAKAKRDESVAKTKTKAPPPPPPAPEKSTPAPSPAAGKEAADAAKANQAAH